ncbi:hypothetical protein FKV71_01090 [Weissella paramesenteroides]|nr:hypothetical protein FKV72_02690 [Weissella paramesenteroides]KAA8454397.1 hypothetical protein FKV71_01090 [Weissella paramesenteroides]
MGNVVITDFLITLFSPVQPRRHRVIFGLLKRRLTVSTEYWGLRYQLLPIIGLLPQLEKNDFDEQIAQLIKQGLLIEQQPSSGQLLLTDKGVTFQQNYRQYHYQLKYIPLMVQPLANIRQFREAFWLANQIVSEVAYQNKHYYPLQIDFKTKKLVKNWYGQTDKKHLINDWFAELTDFLKLLDQQTADQLVATWVGHQIPGRNSDQLDLPQSWTATDFYLWEIDLFSFWSQQLSQTNASSELKRLWELTQQQANLSPSVQLTCQQVHRGMSIETISKQRHLKIGTVREHLLTAAVWLPKADFPYELFLSASTIQYLEQHLTGNIDNWQFSDIRTSDNPNEFFIFRLYEIYLTKQGN